MTSKKTTRRALLSSVIALLLCVSMLVGTTFAWFTDSVVSSNNIIKSGTLDVELQYLDKNQNWADASEGAIFNYQYWEPGYTQTNCVKIVNAGNLAFKYQVNIIPEIQPAAGEVNLADVIDVYVFPDGRIPASREDILATEPVGTLAELMADVDGAAYGYLLPAEGVGSDDYNKDVTSPRGEITYGIVLHMQEEAGNEYQNLSVGGGFKVELLATQYTWENDSFDHMYDEGSEYNAQPKANVGKLDVETIDATWGMGGEKVTLPLDVGYSFKPTESLEEAQASPYGKWHADFVVSADKDVPVDSIALSGYYVAFCKDYNEDRWVALKSDQVIPANTEIRLVEAMGNGGITVNYEEICEFGNDGVGFLCGATDLTGENSGTTITVELRLYEVEERSESNGNSWNVETGNYIVAGVYSYTFE